MAKSYTKIRSTRAEKAIALAFFTPFALLFAIFTIAPVVVALVLSTTNYSVIQPIPIFNAIDNYIYMFTQDEIFITALQNTITFAIFLGPLGYVVSFMVAWILNSLKGKNLFALLFYAPSITSAIAMGVVWLYFFSPDRYGFVNNFLFDMGWISEPILWTRDPERILFITVVVSVWMGMGNGFLAFLAGFQNLDKEIFEAGSIDGIKNKFQELIYILLPMMKPMLLFGAITTIAGAFAVNDIPLTLAGYPGPQNAAMTIVGYMNDYAFTRLDLGYASAVAVFLFAVTFAFGRIVMKVLGSKDE
ncbi:MAG: sugar ABC transporter permease [Oscillospiraceae bacterium]|nr:sugar ABC transporter permease [Oscillospiraceae bacterium]